MQVGNNPDHLSKTIPPQRLPPRYRYQTKSTFTKSVKKCGNRLRELLNMYLKRISDQRLETNSTPFRALCGYIGIRYMEVYTRGCNALFNIYGLRPRRKRGDTAGSVSCCIKYDISSVIGRCGSNAMCIYCFIFSEIHRSNVIRRPVVVLLHLSDCRF